MTNGDMDYSEQKDRFVEKLTLFIRDQTKFEPEIVITKLNSFITDYEKFFNDNKDDKDMIFSLKSDLDWYNNIIKSKRILKKQVKVEEQKQIKKDVTTLQFKYQTSLWSKLFNQRSFNNDLYGQALFHSVLGIICDIKVPIKRNQFIWARPSLFYIQRSRSGKNEGMYFVENILKHFHKKTILNNKPVKVRPIRCLRVGKKTDPTLLNRFVMVNKKGMMEVKRNDDGTPQIIQGELEKNDLIWYPEASYLLNPSNYNEEEVNIHLNLLETEGTFTKELEKWGGLQSETKGGNYSLIAISRPIEDIKKYIVYNGLLQRCLFIARHLSRQERRMMLEMVALHAHSTKKQRQEYEKDFIQLIKDLKEIQDFALLNPPEIRDEESELFISELHKKLMYFDASIQRECSFETNKDIFEDFIANYTNLMLTIIYQSAVIRRSKYVKLVDLEYAFNFFDNMFNKIKPWIEENIEITSSENTKTTKRRSCMYKLKKQVGQKLKISAAIKFISKDLNCSYPTAKTILENFSEQGPFRMVAIDWQKKIVVFL